MEDDDPGRLSVVVVGAHGPHHLDDA